MHNPFGKDISEIEYEDLEKLIENNISEGWFIEYKSSFPKHNKKIANSIASFANSEGGWYIVGIEENEKESGPSEIIGFDLETNKKPADKVTNIIKDNIDPIPYFESKIVEIPENKYVLVVQVFEGHDPPYFSEGSVYIRVGETSKPLAIDNRYQFEKLFDKKQNFENHVNSFMSNTFFFDKGYNQPYLEFYIYVNNPKSILFEDFDSEEFFEKIKENFNAELEINDKYVDLFSFDNIHASIDSYILRHLYKNPFMTGLTLELFKEGHLKLIFPFNVYNKYGLNDHYKTLDTYIYLITEEYSKLRIIDLAESIAIFQSILIQYKILLEEYDYQYELNIKYKFKNFNFTSPFIDSERYIEFIYENKVPINLKKSIDIPNKGYFSYPFKDFEMTPLILNIISATGLPISLIKSILKEYKEKLNSSNKP